VTPRTKNRGGEGKPENKEPRKVFERAFNGGIPMFSQAIEMLKSDRMADRLEGMGALLKLVLDCDDHKALKELHGKCRRAIASKEAEERKAVRSILSQLALNADCMEAKRILEADYLSTIHDFDLEGLVFLGTHGSEGISGEVDSFLESNFDRIGEKKLDVMAYIAAVSGCTLETRMKAAKIAARSEKRAGNLAFIRDTCEDADIKGLMEQALIKRGIHDAETVIDEEMPDPEEDDADGEGTETGDADAGPDGGEAQGYEAEDDEAPEQDPEEDEDEGLPELDFEND
jgi:hypothetical protein